MKLKLLNRLFFIVPLIILTLLYFQKNGIATVDSTLDFIIFAFLLFSSFWLIYEINDYIKYQKRKRKIILNPILKAGIERNQKQYYFNLKIKSNSKEFQVLDNNELRIFLNRQKEQIEIFGTFSKRVFSINEIDFLVFEFLRIELYTFKHDWGRIKWYCNFLIKLKKSNNLIPITAMVSNRDNLKEWGEYEKLDNNDFYYSQGLEIVNILSLNMNTKYAILNHMERKMKKNGG